MRPARRMLRAVLALSLPALAGACYGPVPPGVEYPRDSQSERRFAYEPSAPEPEPASPQAAEAAKPPAASAAPVAAVNGAAVKQEDALAKLDDDPRRLIGLDQAAVTDLLGQPRFVRRDEPAQMWRYRSAACVLDLFLYTEPKGRTGPYRVRHVEARGRGQVAASTRECLRALLVTRLQDRTG